MCLKTIYVWKSDSKDTFILKSWEFSSTTADKYVCVDRCMCTRALLCALSKDNSEIHLKSYTTDVKDKVRAKPDTSSASKAVTRWKEADQHSR